MTSSRALAGCAVVAALATACASGSSHHAVPQRDAPTSQAVTTTSSPSSPLAVRASASVPLVQQVHAAAMGLASGSSGLPASTFISAAAAAREQLVRLAGKPAGNATGVAQQLTIELRSYASVAAAMIHSGRALSVTETARLSSTDQQWVRTVAFIGKKTHDAALEHPPRLPLPAPVPPKSGKG